MSFEKTFLMWIQNFLTCVIDIKIVKSVSLRDTFNVNSIFLNVYHWYKNGKVSFQDTYFKETKNVVDLEIFFNVLYI